jgi:hypothetical protein
MACTTAPTCLAALLFASPILASEREDRQHWDWGQHRTSLAYEEAVPDMAPPVRWDHWDDPSAPVRHAELPFRG